MGTPMSNGRTATIDLLGLGARELEKAVGKSVLIYDKHAERPAVWIEEVVKIDGRAIVGRGALSLPVLETQNQHIRATPLVGNVKFAINYGGIGYGPDGIRKGFDDLHGVKTSWIRYGAGLDSGERPLTHWVNPVGRDRQTT